MYENAVRPAENVPVENGAMGIICPVHTLAVTRYQWLILMEQNQGHNKWPSCFRRQ
jgi:hypothetical protein